MSVDIIELRKAIDKGTDDPIGEIVDYLERLDERVKECERPSKVYRE